MEDANEAMIFGLLCVLLSIAFHLMYRRPAADSFRWTGPKQKRAQQEGSQHEVANYESGFLRLPVELRNQIYEYALPANAFIRHNLYVRVSKQSKYYITDSFQRGNTCYKKSSFPALLQTCRQLRVETKPIFFGRTTACFGERDLCNLNRWPHLEMDTWLKPCQVHGERSKMTFLDILEDGNCEYGPH